MDYGCFYDQILSAEELGGFYQKYWNAGKCLEIELVETINFKYKTNSRKFYNYMLFDSKAFFANVKFLQSLESITDIGCRRFLSGCFYFGKGQADRPNVHIQEALDMNNCAAKHITIRKIWDQGGGVLILKFFFNASSYIASTREAILIDYVGLNDITNIRRGSYYGGIDNWGDNVLTNMGKLYTLKIISGCFEHFEIFLREDLIWGGGRKETESWAVTR